MKKHSLIVRFFGTLTFIFLIALVFTISVEIYFKSKDMYPIELLSYDAHTIWKFNSHIKSINELGFRDVEHKIKPDKHVKRILVIGDSYTAALATPLDKAFTTLLSKNLNSNPLQKYEVINAGVSSWGTDQQLNYYINDGYKHEAEYVVLIASPNDLRESYAKKLCTINNDKLTCTNDRIPISTRIGWFCANRFRVYQYFQPENPFDRVGHILNIFSYYRVNFEIGDSVSWDAPIFLKHPVTEIVEAKKLLGRLIFELKTACEKNEAKLLIASMPTFMEFDESLDSTYYQPGLFAQELGEIAFKQGIPYLNLYEKSLKIDTPTNLYAMIDLHLSEKGNIFVSNHLTQFIQDNFD